MSMNKILLAGVAATFMAGSAVAAEPITLSDSQLDNVTGGFTVLVAGGLIGSSFTVGESAGGGSLTQFATSDQFVVGGPGQLSTLTQASSRNDVLLVVADPTTGVLSNDGSISLSAFFSSP